MVVSWLDTDYDPTHTTYSTLLDKLWHKILSKARGLLLKIVLPRGGPEKLDTFGGGIGGTPLTSHGPSGMSDTPPSETEFDES